MKETTNSNDYESIKKKALEQFRSGKSLTGKGGAFAPLLKQFLEAALQSELEDHLQSDDPQEASNRKNGKVSKTVKTALLHSYGWMLVHYKVRTRVKPGAVQSIIFWVSIKKAKKICWEFMYQKVKEQISG